MMAIMKLGDVLRRIKGFSTPLGGIDWDVPLPQRAVANKVLVYLEDRRVLTTVRGVPEALHDAPQYIESVQKIRETLTQVLMEPDTGDELAGHLKMMRAACRKYLDQVDLNRISRWPHETRAVLVATALGELRGALGIQTGIIAARYKLDVPDGLAAALPAPDTDDDEPALW
ncbi:DUF6650 family protein [Streptomyces sp. NPDC059697]|uniref:DUF6650 family protein n=1 Tax=Streptomyces sp. NPDC059697 TaxID=3346912 RepID=UPI0036C9D6BA